MPNLTDGDTVFLTSQIPSYNKIKDVYELGTYLYLARDSSSEPVSKFLNELYKKNSFKSSAQEIYYLKNLISQDIQYFKTKLESLVDS